VASRALHNIRVGALGHEALCWRRDHLVVGRNQGEQMPNHTDAVAFIGRCLMAVMFFMSRFGKVLAPQAKIALITSVGFPPPEAACAMSIIAEIGGALLLVLGWQTRLLGAGLSVLPS
jgi:uncharacterized membrane protein YphA (DoxX/SURF4 family)